MKTKSAITEIERMFAVVAANELDLEISLQYQTPINGSNGVFPFHNGKPMSLIVDDYRRYYPFNPLKDPKLMSELFAWAIKEIPKYVFDYSLEYNKKDQSYKRLWITELMDVGKVKKYYTRYYLNESIAYLEALVKLRDEEYKLDMMNLSQYDEE